MVKYTSLFKLTIISIIAIVASLLFGDTFADIAKDNYTDIILNFRLPRVLFGFLTGATLSIIGVIVQKVFNNRIATGQTLGITSASSAGAAIAIFISSSQNSVKIHPWILAITLSLLSSMLIVSLFNKFKSSSYTIVAGISIGLMFSSIVLLLQYLTPYTESKSLLVYLTGSLSIYGYLPVVIMAVSTVLLTLFAIKKAQIIDALSIGKGFSLSRGIHFQKEFSLALIVISLALSISVTLSGPVMFVGLIIPNVLHKRGILATKDKVIYSLFFGGIFISVTDALSRSTFSFEIPIGIVTGILGSIFMIYILSSSNK